MIDHLKIRSTSSPADSRDRSSHLAAKSFDLALTIARGGSDRKAADIVLLDVEDVSYLADYFVLMTGFSKVQVRAIARAIQDSVEETFGRSPIQIEGVADGSWVLLDYGEVIAHIFTPHEREYYNLEAFWGHAKRIPLAEIDGELKPLEDGVESSAP